MISVIVPTYQHGSTIAACLNSILGQSCGQTEIIVVNDGSTDDTMDVLAEYTDRIQVISEQNLGANTARNRGFAASQGELVIFCDADVVMHKDMLHELQKALRVNASAAYAYSAFRFGWKSFSSYPFDPNRLRHMNYIHTTALIRRTAFPGFDPSIKRLQDWDLWLTMLERGDEGVYVPQELFRILDDHARKGISEWRPSLLYQIPWKKIGWMPRSIRRFDVARKIILEKHGL